MSYHCGAIPFDGYTKLNRLSVGECIVPEKLRPMTAPEYQLTLSVMSMRGSLTIAVLLGRRIGDPFR